MAGLSSRLVLLAAALLVGAACARPVVPATPPAAPADLHVLTWNMDAGGGDLRRLLDDLAAGRLTGAAPRDFVVLLQEAVVEGGPADARAAAADRGLSFSFGSVHVAGRRSRGNAIMSTMALRETRAIDLPRERQPRAAIAADVTVAGEQLFVVSTHLENRLPWLRGLFGDRARGRQAAALLHGLPAEGHGIVGGDMNTMLGPGEPAWRALLQRFPDTPGGGEPTFRDRLTLDHLFFDLPDGWSATRMVLPQTYGSDHRPVLGVVKVK